ncbi:LuxR family transcriptional regulator [Mycobacterium paragordonae]|uniref:Transcriptional regulator n=1 Tax=Mycobacterium paragordonae TaxID=1389713 RepID=A0ABQ1CAE2_9MYCO|nr:LuxR family transcriptional regulator [Mycobacterium paragordonae]AYE97494.1 LuxR family transcriptional regulator [Mycobacterium paragordonae]GFG81177.1 transcriptional regulator [Mycobacterium paragordonae]
MSQQAEIPSLTWGELGVSELLPTGTVTLLLADVEGSTRLWETQPEQMTAALALLNRTVDDTVAAHDGVRPVEQGEGDSFVAAFARASDAVACALALQRAQLAPIRLRIGLHTGEIQLRDEANYAGPTINRTARLRDLGHGGQTVMSGVTESLVIDRLPEGVWLADLGSYPLRGVPRPERVMQLCHPDLRNEFPPLRVRSVVAAHNLPAQLTSFVGRQAQMADLRQLITENRLVTLTGAGGAGKTRLAVELAGQLAAEFADGVWYIDLAPIANLAAVPVTVARTLGLPDQPGRSTRELLLQFFGPKRVLLLLDNCEHLLDACGELVVELLPTCPRLTILATSREQLGVPGELSWRVPSLSVADEAVDLFIDRARRVRPDFTVGEANTALIAEVCERLDGMPLAIELAAARIRALSLQQIFDSLHDRFRLLTGGARTAVRRQQTLRASVDWSHAMLTDPERILFRRLAVFMGGFDLDAAHGVGADTEAERFQLIDVLGLLVDKSLVVAEEINGAMRYRVLETVRQYGLEKLGESGEAGTVRTRHRDYYAAAAAALASGPQGPLVRWADVEMDNLRAAHAWSRETGQTGTALQLAASLQQFWLTRGRFREGLAAFDAVFTDDLYESGDIAPAILVRAVADAAVLAVWASAPACPQRAEQALAVARKLDDPGLVARILMGCGMLNFYSADAYFDEAIELARASGDLLVHCQLRAYQTFAFSVAGDPLASETAAIEGRDLADAVGDKFMSRYCQTFLSTALSMQGKLTEAVDVSQSLVEDARTAGDRAMETFGLITLAQVLALRGDVASAHAAAAAGLEAAAAIGGFHEDTAYASLAGAALADGDAAAARRACEAAMRHTYPLKELFTRSILPMTDAALGCGDLAAARRWADDTVAVAPGCHQVFALTGRARVALAQAEPDQAERDAHEALVVAVRTRGYLWVADSLEILAGLAAECGSYAGAARVLGAAHGIRQRAERPRLPVYQAGYDVTFAKVREGLGQHDFDVAWAEGSALSVEEAIAYAQRGRGERKRPASGWGSLTPMELDVIGLVAEGLGNKEIGARLFISPRTVQSHLTHVYAKLGLTSRVQLVQESGRRS